MFNKEATKVKNKAGEDTYRPAVYEWQKNRITVNPESKKSAESILIHELDHAVRNYFGKDGQRMSKVFNRALAETDKTTQEKILENSEEVAKPGQLEAVFKDEVNAYYAERMLTNRQTLEKLSEAEPGIKDRILSFFKGASADYADIPKLSGSAKWYYKKFKKMFDDFSTRNSEALANEKSLTSMNQENMQVSDRQYAIHYPNFSKSDIEANIKYIATMKSVKDISAEKLNKTGKKPKQMFAEYFESLGNYIYSPLFGDISLSNSSVKSEGRHGFTAEKVASMEAIPDVIKNGRVIFHKTKGDVTGTVDRIVVAAPIKIGNEDYYMGVMLQRDYHSQRLYLHNVVSIKAEEARTTSQADSLTNWVYEEDSTLFITSILQNAINVKLNGEKTSDKQFALPLDEDSFVANGEEFATPTLSTVGKERMTYKEKAFSKDWLFTKKTSTYIHSVDILISL